MRYEIKSLNGMAKGLGKQVARDNGFSKKELHSYINVSNIVGILKQYCNTKNKKFYIDDKNIEKAYQDIHHWLVGVDLAKHAASDTIDCYWDSDKDCMVFKNKEEKKDDLA